MNPAGSTTTNPAVTQQQRQVTGHLFKRDERLGTFTYTGSVRRTAAEVLPDGYGEAALMDGRVRFSGEWVHGVWNGHGVWVHVDGDKYVGNFLDGQRTGSGTYVFPHGDIYSGQWHKNAWHGHGTIRWADGRFWTGEFVHGEKHGVGIMHFPDGRLEKRTYQSDTLLDTVPLESGHSDFEIAKRKEPSARQAKLAAQGKLDLSGRPPPLSDPVRASSFGSSDGSDSEMDRAASPYDFAAGGGAEVGSLYETLVAVREQSSKEKRSLQTLIDTYKRDHGQLRMQLQRAADQTELRRTVQLTRAGDFGLLGCPGHSQAHVVFHVSCTKGSQKDTKLALRLLLPAVPRPADTVAAAAASSAGAVGGDSPSPIAKGNEKPTTTPVSPDALVRATILRHELSVAMLTSFPTSPYVEDPLGNFVGALGPSFRSSVPAHIHSLLGGLVDQLPVSINGFTQGPLLSAVTMARQQFKGSVPEEFAMGIIEQLLLAASHLHDHYIQHRDICVDTIVVMPPLPETTAAKPLTPVRFVLVDFGSAITLPKDRQLNCAPGDSRWGPTSPFVPPELASANDGELLTMAKLDLWAIAAMTMDMACIGGFRPARGKCVPSGEAPDGLPLKFSARELPRFPSNYSDAFRDFLKRLLAVDTIERPELRQAIALCQDVTRRFKH